MLPVEITYIIIFLALAVLATMSDIKSGVIRNKTLIVFASIAICMGVLYYGVVAPYLAIPALLNLSVMLCISLCLFYFHSFAGGDSKLVLVMAMLFPAKYYWIYNDSSMTLVFALGLAIFYGYIYLLLSSVYSLIRGESKISGRFIKDYLTSFLKSFVSAMIYVGAVNIIFQILALHGIYINVWFSRLLCIGVAWAVGRCLWLKKKWLLILVLFADVLVGYFVDKIPFSLNPENYVLVFVLLLCQMTIRTSTYEEIAVSDLRTGMILSVCSSALMQGSRIRGLPGISTEDLSSRLTVDEIESIRRWAQSHETANLSIVKKIPFAVFISLGYISYFILGRLLS